MNKPPVIWTIAGFDPSSGAGITADLKTISSFHCYGQACITALTIQNTMGVRRVEAVDEGIVRETLEVLLADMQPDAIKIGMLATADIVAAVADFLSNLPQPRCPVVLDPILRSSSGAALLDTAGVRLLVTRLLPLTTVVTPNLYEAAILTGAPEGDGEALAQALRQIGASSVVVTGGDATNSDLSEDVLAYAVRDMEFVETLSAPRVHSESTHGTGCAFSTAIACALARGQNIPNAVTTAKGFVRNAIEHAPGLGHGKGPMGLDCEWNG
jgi:hydroxymethylpyrimidine/phosphomethylpyrimidine kinase